MTKGHSAICGWFLISAIALMSAGCAGDGVKASDPHLVGKRDMNYDHVIVPADRIGPVGLGSKVSEVVQHLGEPDSVSRSTYRGPGITSDEVYYYYRDECIEFTWQDTGLEPTVENGLRGINVTCGKWVTQDGLRVGMPIKDVISHLGAYCASNRDDGSLVVATKTGIWFEAPDRNSDVTRILVMPTQTSWGGMCTD